MSDSSVRVRFAPSPTGLLHIGGLRTALYNYLFARQHGGTFVLRVEDTDRNRYVPEAEPDILESLAWAGLDIDEGPEQGGPFEPYYQSERSELYRKYADQLVEKGQAYYAFDTEEELDALRSRGEGVAYDASTRGSMRNSLALSDEEVDELLSSGAEYVVRLKVPAEELVRFDDIVRGGVRFDTAQLDDQVLLKSDGLPTYHLANVVDDHHMEITHVIRGEEWLSSTPKHVLLYEYFGWEPPQFAHLPLILSSEGGKLSKRNADTLGIPVSVVDYRKAGFEAEAVINFLAFLGWNPGDEREVFTLEELVEAFDLERVGSSGVQFSMDKLQWFNQQHLHTKSAEALAEHARPYLEEEGLEASDDYLVDVVAILKDRLHMIEELVTENRFFFEAPSEYDETAVAKKWKDNSAELLAAIVERIEGAASFTPDEVESIVKATAKEHDAGLGRLMLPIRIAITGETSGPSVYQMLSVLGREECVRRMNRAIEELG